MKKNGGRKRIKKVHELLVYISIYNPLIGDTQYLTNIEDDDDMPFPILEFK